VAVVCGAGLLALIALGALTSHGGPRSGRSDVPPSSEAELQAYVEDAGANKKAPGVRSHTKILTLYCQLTIATFINDNPNLLAVNLSAGRHAKGYMDPNGIAYVERYSSAGRDITDLLGDGGWHMITVQLGTPQRGIVVDGVLEIVRAWKYDGKQR
jgi:hypothetical protein